MMSKLSFCTNCFKSLGVPSRMVIYNYLLKKKKATVSDIVDHIKLTQPTVSYHLNEMKDHGILVSEKKGKEVFYSLSQVCPHFDRGCVLQKIDFPPRPYA